MQIPPRRAGEVWVRGAMARERERVRGPCGEIHLFSLSWRRVVCVDAEAGESREQMCVLCRRAIGLTVRGYRARRVGRSASSAAGRVADVLGGAECGGRRAERRRGRVKAGGRSGRKACAPDRQIDPLSLDRRRRAARGKMRKCAQANSARSAEAPFTNVHSSTRTALSHIP